MPYPKSDLPVWEIAKLSDVIAFNSKSLWRKNVSMKAWNGEQKIEHLWFRIKTEPERKQLSIFVVKGFVPKLRQEV